MASCPGSPRSTTSASSAGSGQSGGARRRGGAAATPYLCVYASQVAACIGRNRHRKVSDAMLAMWERVSPAGYREALARNQRKTDDDVLLDLLQTSTPVRSLLDRSATAAGEVASSAQAAASYLGAAHELDRLDRAELGDRERQVVDAALKRTVYTGYGSRAETEMLAHIRDVLDIPCRADPAFYKKRMGEVDGVPWFVGGKIDAISDDRQLVIEIKNRVNRLFYRAPAYEAVQVQAYLELLDVHQGALVECLKGDGGGVQANVIPVARDKAFWRLEVVPKLERFVAFLVRLLRDPATQDAFLTSKRPSAMVLA